MARKKSKNKATADATAAYFRARYNSTSLSDWQRLCRDLDLDDELLGSIAKCKKALRKVHVNIYDFQSALSEGTPVHHFKNDNQLREYTIRTGKTFPRGHAKESGPVRALMREIF
ncbi:hypothetical protein B0T17DRAFT_509788 [Bombardia bombarda]|uniref:Uncharacterized protein n=1 Tax=Bombardia bombarda TaxID=252184 RepID=A0AA39WMQ3_9PEZI|nr:hypothetical protein B0T17DRAFT_509788 [Bombardia bombarda]